MRRICLILLLTTLAVPAASLAADRAGDGGLAVSGASGTVIVQGKGLIYGHVDQGTVMVVEYRPDDSTDVVAVTGAKPKTSRGATFYSGTDVRFLMPSGRFTIELIGTGIDASAVGKGIVWATGFGTADDGTYAVNGAKPQPLSTGSSSQSFGGK